MALRRYHTVYDIHIPIGEIVQNAVYASELGSDLTWMTDHTYGFVHVKFAHDSREESQTIRERLQEVTGWDVIQWETVDSETKEKFYDMKDHT